MSQKVKISREDILLSAYDIALTQGISAVSSRNVAKAVGCSVQPIFSQFPSMEDLKQETYRYACRLCAEEVLNAGEEQDFLTVLAQWMLDVAKNRPKLFELLYLSEISSARYFSKALMEHSSHRKMALKIAENYGISLENGEDLLIRSCLFLMGIGTMISINQMDMGQEEVLDMMNRTVQDMVRGAGPVSHS